MGHAVTLLLQVVILGTVGFLTALAVLAGLDAYRAHRHARRRAGSDEALGRLGSEATLAVALRPDASLDVTIAGERGAATVTIAVDERARVAERILEGLPAHAVYVGAFLRPEVREFALAMETRFRAKDPARGWPPVFAFGLEGLRNQIRDELVELEALATFPTTDRADHRDVELAAADVANLALLIAIWHRREAAAAAGVRALEQRRLV